jgi:hypothetical protein
MLGVQDLAEDAGKKGGWCWGSRTFPKTQGRKEAVLGEQDLAGDVWCWASWTLLARCAAGSGSEQETLFQV